MSDATILIVDDEPQIRRVMRTTLTSHGYSVVEAASGEEALEKLRAERPDLIILDVNMPGMQALDAGADDYVVKPFGVQELMARIRAALRRSAPGDATPAFLTDDLRIDFDKRVVTVKNNPVRLTPKEFELLRHLVANQGKTLGHRRLLQAVWGPDYGEETEYLRVFINQLRKKIEPDPHKPRYILTEPWVGYRFDPLKVKTSAADLEK